MSRTINGHIWYYSLKPNPETGSRGLFSFYKPRSLDGKLILCLINRDDVRHYAVFDTYMKAYQFINAIDEEYRAFFEVIRGRSRQKPKYDIDIGKEALQDTGSTIASAVTGAAVPVLSDEEKERQLDAIANSLINCLIDAICRYFRANSHSFNPATDLLLYNSHGVLKRSFHLVLTNHAHNNNKEAGMFYEAVKELCNHPHKHCIDHAVYKSIQQYRLIGSQKMHSGRVKRMMPVFMCEGKEVTHLYQDEVMPLDPALQHYIDFQESLVSNVLSSYPVVPIKPTMAMIKKSTFKVGREITDEIASEAFEALRAHYEIRKLDLCFHPLGIVDSFVLLKRDRAGPCIVCTGKRHENENAFLTVVAETVYFHCRRSTGGSCVVGRSKSAGVVTVPAPEEKENEARCFVFGNIVIKKACNGKVTYHDGEPEAVFTASLREIAPVDAANREIAPVESKKEVIHKKKTSIESAADEAAKEVQRILSTPTAEPPRRPVHHRGLISGDKLFSVLYNKGIP